MKCGKQTAVSIRGPLHTGEAETMRILEGLRFDSTSIYLFVFVLVNSSKVVCTKDHIGYDLPTQMYNSSEYSSISLRDPACKPTSGSVTMKLRADLGNSCGTTIRETGTHFIYENEVVLKGRNASMSSNSSIITRSGDKSIAFSCSYEK